MRNVLAIARRILVQFAHDKRTLGRLKGKAGDPAHSPDFFAGIYRELLLIRTGEPRVHLGILVP